MRAVNLIPAEQRSGSAVGTGRSEGGAHAVLALVAGLAVLALLYGIAHHQIASRRAEAASVTAQAQQAQTAADRLAPYASFIALREQRTQAVSTLVDSRFDWAHVFHEFGRVLPLQVSIASLTGTVGSASPVPVPATAGAAGAAASTVASSSTPPGSVPTFTLVGCATSQPAVALMLERLHLMDGVRAVTLQSSAKASSAGSSGGCPSGSPPGDPSFSVQISFDPLPSASAAAASAKAVTVSTATASKAVSPTTAGKSSK
jgi:hypothetical protein